MGYYINVLTKGKKYDLDGQKLLFIDKVSEYFRFYKCKMDEWSFRYEPTSELVEFDRKEINFIKPFHDEQNQRCLTIIGRDKVFKRD